MKRFPKSRSRPRGKTDRRRASPLRASVISSGDELVNGITLDTNSGWLVSRLASMGAEVVMQMTVGDSLERIVGALETCLRASDAVVINGGLGPTDDDLTREALARVSGSRLVRDNAALKAIKELFEARKWPMAASNARQAMRPASAKTIPNSCGTAPGIEMRVGRAVVFAIPGVPSEMRAMFDDSVARRLAPRLASAGNTLVTRTLSCWGLGESRIGERIADLMARGRNPAVGTTASGGIVSVRIYGRGAKVPIRKAVDALAGEVAARLAPHVFSDRGESLAASVARLLAARGQTVAVAESCTGGLVAKMLTDVAGSSAYMLRGYVTYGNDAKTDDLDLPAAVIRERGAVSAQTCALMARGARLRAGSTWGISVTGIAGPGGGTKAKPVGLVFVGLAGPRGTVVVRNITPGDRDSVRTRSALTALSLLRWTLLGVDVSRLLDVAR